MKSIDFKVVIDTEKPFLNNQDIQKMCGVKYGAVYNYLQEFKSFCYEKHIYPMECYFEFFGKIHVDKYAFCHFMQYRDAIKTHGIYEEYNEEKYRKKLSQIKFSK